MHVVIFEDSNYNNFYPLTLTRPVWDLRSGCGTLRERWSNFLVRRFGDSILNSLYYSTRDYLAPLYREKYPGLRINDYGFTAAREPVLFINSTLLPHSDCFNINLNECIARNNTVLAALIEPGRMPLTPEDIQRAFQAMPLTPVESHDISVFNYLWDIVSCNAEMITRDYGEINLTSNERSRHENSVTIIGDPNLVYIGRDARIDPYVCIDCTGGPVVIGERTVVHSFTRIEGPCATGSDCILLGARIREGCSFGNNCRIGGEVEESIFQGYANKYHDGFIGHAFVGEWVNFGAMTTNSDLKNNYAPVKVTLPGGRVSSEKIKVGCFVGDYTRTSIGTLINTGSAFGSGCMIVHGGSMAPRHMPPFSWFINNQLTEGEPLQSTLATCREMARRRGVVFSDNYSGLVTHVYSISEENRKSEVIRWRELRK